MTTVRRLRPLLLLLILPLALLSLRETRRVSACAARGGSFDHATGHCDAARFQADGPSAPVPGRNQVLIGAVLVAAGGAGVAMVLRRRAIHRRA